MSWLPDILVYRASIIPTIIGSVTVVTLFATGVAVVSLWWGKEVGLTNNVGKSTVLRSVVDEQYRFCQLSLAYCWSSGTRQNVIPYDVFNTHFIRNSSAYERYAE